MLVVWCVCGGGEFQVVQVRLHLKISLSLQNANTHVSYDDLGAPDLGSIIPQRLKL